MIDTKKGGGMQSRHPAPVFFENEEPEWTQWEAVVDTSLAGQGNVLASVPFYLYLQPDAMLKVEWGDGRVSFLDMYQYTHFSSIASVHAYDRPGRYTIRMLSQNWTKIRICTCSGMVIGEGRYNDKSACLRWWRQILVSCGRLPLMGGTVHFHQCSPSPVLNGAFDNASSLNSIFEECVHLETVPADVFSEWTMARSFRRAFWNCRSLRNEVFGAIKFPPNADIEWCFYGCRGRNGVDSYV